MKGWGKQMGDGGGSTTRLCAPSSGWPELVPTMLVSQRMSSCRDNRVGLGSAFEVLEPCAGKLARTVLRGCLESQPRRGAGIKPGASAPGRGAQKNHQAPKGRRQSTDRTELPAPLRGFGVGLDLFLGLKPQATCLHPFGIGFRDTL